MNEFEQEAKKYFSKNVTDRDRAIFEGAITLGAIFHQFIGTPVKNDPKTIEALEKSIELSMSCQPYIEKVDAKIVPSKLKSGEHSYDYSELKGENLVIKVISKYGNVRVHSRMKYIDELDFPLMYIENIEE
ncbi:MAG: dihydroneopterin aldolase family protein [Candidatus Hodarchaeota archaeon]